MHQEDLGETHNEHLRSLAQKARLPPHVVGAGFAGEGITEAVKGHWNRARLGYFGRSERPYYSGESSPHWPAEAPQSCIAISGGGIRSAAFALGVLQGLEHQGHLATTDILSSVSGGSYATSWIYSQALQFDAARRADPLPHLFAESSPYLAGLAARAGYFVDTVDGLANAAAGLVGRPLCAVAAIPAQNTVPRFCGSHSGYASDIRRMFHDGRRVAPQELRDLLGGTALPFPVFNATGRTAPNARCEGSTDRDENPRPLADSAFEFTPLRHGSDGLGYTAADPRLLDLGHIVGISGAALDDPYGKLCQYIAWTGVGLGAFIHGFESAPDLEPRNAGSEIEPRRQRVYLSDGGFADNLGVFPLVRRLCRRIVVIDSAHDPCLAFTAYQRLRRALREEMGVTLSVPEIDHLFAANTVPCPAGEECIRTARQCGRELPEDTAFLADQLEHPVMTGSIAAFPFPDRAPLELEVVYIKLSLDADRLATYSSTVQRVYAASEHPTCRKATIGRKCPFPQYSTLDQDYSDLQFRAYRELGAAIVQQSRSLFSP